MTTSKNVAMLVRLLIFVWSIVTVTSFSTSLTFSRRLLKLQKTSENSVQLPSRCDNFAVSASLSFLERENEASDVPMNLFKAKDPFLAKVMSVKRLTGPAADGEICEVVVNHDGKIPFLEGQSYGVIAPGQNPKNGRPHNIRLYSIASTRYGDDLQGNTASLCVRRSLFMDESGAEDPDKQGVCSNFLCDARPGDEVMLTGPAGKALLLPANSPEADIILVATGTGVASYRGFLRRLFVEDTPAAAAFTGLAWLFLGVPSSDGLLYDAEWRDIKARHPEQFRFEYALSREQTNPQGGKMYIQDRLRQHADELFARLASGAHIYFCGLRGMMPGILNMLESVCEKNGVLWTEVLKSWKEKGQWHVEVY